MCMQTTSTRRRVITRNSDQAIVWRWDSAEAFGATGAVFLKGTVNPYNPKCMRGSAGSVFRLPIVTDGDVGGLIGAHFREELKLDCPIVSIDGLDLREFDYIDIGQMLEYSGAVPVVIKSLVFSARHEGRTAG